MKGETMLQGHETIFKAAFRDAGYRVGEDLLYKALQILYIDCGEDAYRTRAEANRIMARFFLDRQEEKQNLAGQRNSAENGHHQNTRQNQTNDPGRKMDGESSQRQSPDQPNGGTGQPRLATNSHRTNSRPFTQHEPTKSQTNERFGAKLLGAQSFFDTYKFIGKPIGSWSYRGLAVVAKDGSVAQALIEEIGPIADGDKDRDLRDLIPEDKLRKILVACGRLQERAA